jgi:hypothetical protein
MTMTTTTMTATCAVARGRELHRLTRKIECRGWCFAETLRLNRWHAVYLFQRGPQHLTVTFTFTD